MRQISMKASVMTGYILDVIKSIITEAMCVISGGAQCVVCGNRCGALSICKNCQARLISDMSKAVTPDAFCRCAVCGKVLISEKNVCMHCRDEGTRVLHSTARVLPISSYRLMMRNLLILWKEEGQKALTPFFAERIIDALDALEDTIIVPVPPRRGKLRIKGWDQIDSLCKYIGHTKQKGSKGQAKFKVLKLLYRTNNIEQKSRTSQERLSMIGSNTYMAKEGKELSRVLRSVGNAMPQKVCLIDDVMTTGATIECCAAALQKAGVKQVDAVTLFIAN